MSVRISPRSACLRCCCCLSRGLEVVLVTEGGLDVPVVPRDGRAVVVICPTDRAAGVVALGVGLGLWVDEVTVVGLGLGAVVVGAPVVELLGLEVGGETPVDVRVRVTWHPSAKMEVRKSCISLTPRAKALNCSPSPAAGEAVVVVVVVKVVVVVVSETSSMAWPENSTASLAFAPVLDPVTGDRAQISSSAE